MSEGGQNSAASNELSSFVKRLEQVDADRLEWQMAHVAEGKRFAEDRREIYKEAKERGVSVKALRAAVKTRDYERKAEAEREKLEEDDVDTFDKIRLAMGDLADTPLGAAALAGKREQDGRTAGIVAAVKKSAGAEGAPAN